MSKRHAPLSCIKYERYILFWTAAFPYGLIRIVRAAMGAVP